MARAMILMDVIRGGGGHKQMELEWRNKDVLNGCCECPSWIKDLDTCGSFYKVSMYGLRPSCGSCNFSVGADVPAKLALAQNGFS